MSVVEHSPAGPSKTTEATMTLHRKFYQSFPAWLGHDFQRREFKLSEAQPSRSKQAAVERQQQQQGQELSFQPRTSNGQVRSKSAGPQRPVGGQRLEQLSRPKTGHWEKCKYVHLFLVSSCLPDVMKLQICTRKKSKSICLSLVFLHACQMPSKSRTVLLKCVCMCV